ncbi:MAG: glycine cleavage T C-terminal barrel domain-containing protein, partial [Salaquimonas sp.]
HSVINGPITYTIDGAPLVGPIPGKRNAFCIIGLRAGLGEGGGHGWLLAQQIVHGEAQYDTWVIDPRRFTGHATTELTALKAIEDYQNEFRFHLPHEHRPAGRPMKTTPLTPLLASEGAEFGVVNGWERVAYIKPSADFHETHGFKFNETFDVVGDEIKAVQTGVGLTEVNGFNRFEITGSGAKQWLDTLFCGSVKRKKGRVALGYLLNDYGNIKGEATLAYLEDDKIWYGSAAASEYHDMDWLKKHLPKDGSVEIKALTNEHTILVLAGPKSRAVLQAVSRDDWSSEAFPWLSVRKAFIGIAPAIVMSVSFSGELAYEIHVPNNQLTSAYLALRKAGDEHGLKLFGSHAVESMRLEKGYRHWKADLITEFTPHESALSRFVKADKEDFVGKAALLKSTPKTAFVSLVLDCDHAPAHGGDSIVSDGKVIGTITSAGWGYRTGKNIAMGFVNPAYSEIGTVMAVEVIGEPVRAEVVPECLYDPENKLVKA